MITKDKIIASFLENDRIKEFLREIEEAFKDILDFLKELEGKLFIEKPKVKRAVVAEKYSPNYKIKRIQRHRSRATYK